jgi:hypothetical protein
MRATVNRQTGYTPNMMMLGHEVLQPLDLLLGMGPANQEMAEPASLRDHVVGLCSVHAYYDLKAKHRAFEIGDLVYEINSATKVNVGQSTKLQPIWKGPLLVTKVLSTVLYEVRDRRHSRIVHQDRLKICVDREIPLGAQDPAPARRRRGRRGPGDNAEGTAVLVSVVLLLSTGDGRDSSAGVSSE